MKKYSLTILVMFLVHFLPYGMPVFAVNQDKIDSLRAEISGRKENHELLETFLLITGEFFSAKVTDSMIFYNDQAKTLAIKLKDKAALAETYLNEYRSANLLQDVNASLDALRKYFSLEKFVTDQQKLCKTYYNFALLNQRQGETDTAIFYLNKCRILNKTLNDSLMYIAISNSMGNIYQESLSKYDSAVICYLDAARMCQSTGNKQYLRKMYNNLGKTYHRLNDFTNARKYFDLSLNANRAVGDTSDMILNLINIGGIFLVQHRFDSATYYYGQAEKLATAINDVVQLTDLFNNYAAIYKETGRYDDALRHYFKALAYYRTQHITEKMLISLRNIGDIYKRQQNYKLALIYIDSALTLAESKEYLQSKSDILKSFVLLYEQMGDYKKAFGYQREFMLLYDTLLDIEKDRIVKDLTLKYEKEQDQAKILALEKENLKKDLHLKEKTLQRNAFLYSGITVLAFAIFLFLYINQKRRKDRIIARQKILQLEEEKKLLAAKSLVEGQEEERKRIANELHDGLGVLLSATKMQFSAIRDTNPENIPLIKKAIQLLEQASGDVRIISHNMMPGLLTRFGLYDAARDLFDKINDEGTLDASCYIQESLKRFPENQEIMLYRIIQEIVNNALKHAAASNIRLEIQVSGDKLEIIFSDNGKGFDVEKMLESRTLGLKSIQSRVDFLNGELQIKSGPGQGTRYIIHVDYMLV